jgi:hypothetical protein
MMSRQIYEYISHCVVRADGKYTMVLADKERYKEFLNMELMPLSHTLSSCAQSFQLIFIFFA